ncbi:uncharacterized protein LOC123676164 isoform X2 [Harmonia axyridis]|uniref:uncharacterized protein LOC123676164 isoform X2 n=1 Tax=Harmonia axyridis TaxID=115357 RepID=UPI001E276F19|nr:uncharacterized protein LOC123676164 isoform X2 [Harmonia axyridis]
MDKFPVRNYIDMFEMKNSINPFNYVRNETARRTKKDYTTKVHVLEKPSKKIDFHLEGPLHVLKTTKQKRSRILTIPKPPKVTKQVEILDAMYASREVERRSSHTDLSKLFKTSRKPHPVLTENEIKDIQKNGSNHDEIMSIHIKKMKEGIERLQEITQKFNCTETYKEDVEYLIRNVKKAISRAETKSKQSDCK